MPAKKTTRKSAKKAPARKTTAKKKTAAKKPAARKPVAKKTATKKAPAKKAAAKKPAKKKTARKPNAAFMKALTPSSDLAMIVGSKPLPRTAVTSGLWKYIKKNGLQDQKNRRMINADPALTKVFGGQKSVSMFEMTKLVSKHLS
jgi:upstream activation factor subunit UAF30